MDTAGDLFFATFLVIVGFFIGLAIGITITLGSEQEELEAALQDLGREHQRTIEYMTSDNASEDMRLWYFEQEPTLEAEE